MRMWRRKLKGVAGGFALGLHLLHTWAGGPLLPDLPKVPDPVVGRDWERLDPQHSAEPLDWSINASPSPSGWAPADYVERFDRWGMEP